MKIGLYCTDQLYSETCRQWTVEMWFCFKLHVVCLKTFKIGKIISIVVQ